MIDVKNIDILAYRPNVESKVSLLEFTVRKLRKPEKTQDAHCCIAEAVTVTVGGTTHKRSSQTVALSNSHQHNFRHQISVKLPVNRA
jgi:hypothetical protein